MWGGLTGQQRVCVGITTFLVGVAGVVHLAPGICLRDSGDLQAAAATLGIAHPPGYVGYAACGWVLCKVLFFVPPAVVVSLACLGCVCWSVWLIAGLLIRSGVHEFAACAVVLGLVAQQSAWQSSVWQSMVAPEVYAPSWLLLVGAVHWLLRYGRSVRGADLCVAAGLFGFLVINRPSSLFYAPAMLGAWLVIRWRCRESTVPFAKHTVSACVVMIASVVGVLGLVWERDGKVGGYNSIDQYAQAGGGLPDRSDGFAARVRRVRWLVTAEQFQGKAILDRGYARQKLQWMSRVFRLPGPGLGLLAVGVLGVGVLLIRRCGWDWAWVGAGIVVGNVVFLCVYQVRGQAANVMPMMFGGVLLVGAVVGRVFPVGVREERFWLAGIGLVGMGAWTVYHSGVRYNYADSMDARAFVAGIGMGGLPEDSVICVDSERVGCVWYEKAVTWDREDVRVVVAGRDQWYRFVGSAGNGPVYYCDGEAATPAGWVAVPAGRLWRVERVGGD